MYLLFIVLECLCEFIQMTLKLCFLMFAYKSKLLSQKTFISLATFVVTVTGIYCSQISATEHRQKAMKPRDIKFENLGMIFMRRLSLIL